MTLTASAHLERGATVHAGMGASVPYLVIRPTGDYGQDLTIHLGSTIDGDELALARRQLLALSQAVSDCYRFLDAAQVPDAGQEPAGAPSWSSMAAGVPLPAAGPDDDEDEDEDAAGGVGAAWDRAEAWYPEEDEDEDRTRPPLPQLTPAMRAGIAAVRYDQAHPMTEAEARGTWGDR